MHKDSIEVRIELWILQVSRLIGPFDWDLTIETFSNNRWDRFIVTRNNLS